MSFSPLLKKMNNIVRNALTNKNICMIGVDGTGKSSIINELIMILREDTTIQYMGNNKRITKIARKRFDSNHTYGKHTISKFINLITWLIEMWYRVARHWPKENIIIYDRYAWDRYVYTQGLIRTISKIFFKTLFPKPKYIFYLHCPLSVSLGRKEDIFDAVEFKRIKDKFDAEFLKSKSIININTKENDMNSTISTIIESIPQNFLKKTSGIDDNCAFSSFQAKDI